MGIPVYPLGKSHNRSDFDCGEESLNKFLKTQAGQYDRRDMSRTHVWVKDGHVAGFYTLSMGSVRRESMPEATVKNLPNHPVPIATIGRLAIDLNYQGGGTGSALLMHALEKCYKHSIEMGMLAVFVDALHEKAKKFYLRNDFVALDDEPLRLYITRNQLKKIFHSQ